MSRISLKISGKFKKFFPEILVATQLFSNFAQKLFINLVWNSHHNIQIIRNFYHISDASYLNCFICISIHMLFPIRYNGKYGRPSEASRVN